MKCKILNFSLCASIVFNFISCSSDDDQSTNTNEDQDSTTVNVDSSYFIEGNVTIELVQMTLSNGQVADCYAITNSNSTSIPVEHDMGPWCPESIDDLGEDAGGIWLDNGIVYNVDGDFLKNLADFYDDSNWKIYDEETDTYNVITTREGCEQAAQPEVPEEYNNFCVQCLPEWYEDDDLTHTYYIPVTPVKLDESQVANGTRGLALNGVIFEGPAPVEAILSAYTIAAFDNAGGHINPFEGYHYHTSTGMSKTIEQDDEHTGMIGYALDGFGMYEQTVDSEENEADLDLDDCRGHEDDLRGYHYHVSAPGVNEFIPCFYGAYVVN